MIPRVHIAQLPTPVDELPRLSAELGGPRLWVKRDDQTGLAFGGNKIRKLEFVLGEALENGAKTLVTVGAAQSNHCRQTAALAARCGLDCILVLSGEKPAEVNGNLLLDELLGAEIVWTTRELRDQTLQQVFGQAQAAGRKPHLIPLGASDATGTLGYAFAMQELLDQGQRPDWIIVASSSAGTQAGLVLGARRAGFQGHILGISIDHSVEELCADVARLAAAASARMGEPIHFDPAEIEVNADYLGKGYGILGEPEREAIRLFARCEGLFLDPVYTGRAAAGLIGLVRAGFFRPQDQVLFLHTGGTPALFAAHYAADLLSD